MKKLYVNMTVEKKDELFFCTIEMPDITNETFQMQNKDYAPLMEKMLGVIVSLPRIKNPLEDYLGN